MTAHSLSLVRTCFALVALLVNAIAQAGHIENRPDGTTVIHVTIYSLPDPTQTDAYARAEAAALKEFQRSFGQRFAERYRSKYEADPKRYGKHDWSKVEVELHSFVGINVQGVETDTMAIAGGRPPDVLYLNFRKSDHYIQSGFLYPLDRVGDDYLTSIPSAELTQRVHPKIWPVIRRIGADGQTHVWALPKGGALGTALLYRKDLFDAAGLRHPTADWNWNDLLNACRKLSDPARGVQALIGGRGQHESWYWLNYLWAAGGEVMEQDPESGMWRLTFDTQEAAASLDFYTQLKTEKWTDSAGIERRGYMARDTYSRDAWIRGQVAMCFDYVDGNLLASVNPDVTGMVPTPKGLGGHRGSELNSQMMGLSSQIQDAAVRDAAWEFMKFSDSEAALRIKTRVLVEGGFGPFVNPQHLRRFGFAEIERLAPKGWAEVFQTAVDTGRPEPYGTNASYVYQLLTYPVQAVEEMAMAGSLPSERDARLQVIQQTLHQALLRANEEMLGKVDPADRRKRDVTAYCVLAAGVALLIVLAYRMVAAASRRQPDPADKLRPRSRLWAYLLLAPALLSILVWQYGPLLQGSVMAFQDYQLQGNSEWVGVQNFGDLLYNSYWWQSVWNALRYSFLIMALTFLPPVLLAMLLQEVPRGSLIFRIIFYLPAVLSGLVTIILWKQFYEPSENGVLNKMLMPIPAIAYIAIGAILLVVAFVFARRLIVHGSRMHAAGFVIVGIALFASFFSWAMPIMFPAGETWSWGGIGARLMATPSQPYRWLTDPGSAMLACVIPMAWASMGPGCLIYLAALKGISDDYYEAADIDGAGLVDKILFIAFPILRPLILINFIGVFIGSWYGAESNILAMTGGSGNTEVAGLHIFYKAFQGLKFGPATAMAWVLAFMLIGFTAYQLRIISKLEFRTTGGK